jgi:rsbT co-antagonist protein RsbR
VTCHRSLTGVGHDTVVCSARLARHLRVQLGDLAGSMRERSLAVGSHPPRGRRQSRTLPPLLPSLASLTGLPHLLPALASLTGLSPCPRCPGAAMALGQVPSADHILRARHNKARVSSLPDPGQGGCSPITWVVTKRSAPSLDIRMAASTPSRIPDLLEKHQSKLIASWLERQLASGSLRAGQIREDELKEQSQKFLREFLGGLKSAHADDVMGPGWSTVRELLGEFSRSRALQGFTPSDTATFIFSLKEPLFTLLRQELKGNAQALGDEIWTATKLIDKLGLYTAEVYQQSRDDIIKRQAQELLELSTPVVELWDKILALPLIGTLDSERTQTVMENLLNHIVKSGAEIAIIDITGVPTVDTLVAQHLIKTVSAARLMGADCIISGIRPQIAQTIVHLGLQLDVVSKATMADAFALALKRTGQAVARAAARPA